MVERHSVSTAFRGLVGILLSAIMLVLLTCAKEKVTRPWDNAPLGSLLNADGSVPVPTNPVKITYWTVPVLPKGEERWVEEKIREFTKLHPNISITYEVLTWEGQAEKYQAALLNGNLPDVMMQGICEGGPHRGGCPLGGWISQSDVADYLPGVLESYRYPGDGKYYGFPQICTHNATMYVNVDMFEAVGIDWQRLREKPWNMKEFVEIAQKLTIDRNGDGKIDQYGFGFGGKAKNYEGLPLLTNVMLTLGGDIESKDGEGFAVESPEFKQALQFCADLIYKYRVTPREVLGQSLWDVQPWWYRGEFAIYQGGGTYVIKEAREYNEQVKKTGEGKPLRFAAVLPIYEEHPVVRMGPGGVSVKDQNDRDKVYAAVAFAKFLTSTEGCKRAQDIYMLPARKSSGNLFAGDEEMEVALCIARDYGVKRSFFISELTQMSFDEVFKKALAPNIEAVFSATFSVDNAVAKMKQAIQPILENTTKRLSLMSGQK
jgi:multiple sugar transport system substrate-binding protein